MQYWVRVSRDRSHDLNFQTPAWHGCIAATPDLLQAGMMLMVAWIRQKQMLAFIQEKQ